MTTTHGRLHQLGLHHGTDKATFHGYCDFYQQHLPAKITRLLEIGVMDGASLKMWRDYYPDAMIIGVDNTRSPMVHGVRVHQADATDPDDVAEIIAEWGPFDVIIDDGSHMTRDQQVTANLLWPSLRPGGRYVIEDLHTSMMPNYVNTPRTTLEKLYDGPLAPDASEPIIWRNPAHPLESITAIVIKAPEPIGPTIHDEVHD